MMIGEYSLEKRIGKGAFSEVYRTQKLGDNTIYATKKVQKETLTNEKVKGYFNNEIFILKNISHPNIIKLYDIKESLNTYYLIFEYCNGGSLMQCLDKYKKKNYEPFPQEIVQHFMRQIVEGLRYIHNMKILHRDIKLDNILINFKSNKDLENLNYLNSEIKIIDFGFARYLENDNLAQSILGSPMYMDPQLLRKMKRLDNNNSFGYDQKVDIWSLGTICYEMLIGAPPFNAQTIDGLVNKISEGDYKIPKNLKLSKEVISFLNGMLQYNPSLRLDINSLYNHNFLVKDIKDFHPIDVQKCESKFNNKNEIIINTKDQQNIWFLFQTEDEENNKKIKLDDIPNNMVDINRMKNDNTEYKGIEGQPEEILNVNENYEESNIENKNDKISEINSAQFSNLNINKQNNNNNNNNDNNKNDNNLSSEQKELLKNAFELNNKDFFYVEPMILPIAPMEDPSLFQIDL